MLDRVARGEEVIITRHDKPIARMVPEGRRSLAEVQAAVAELSNLRDSIRKRRGFKPLTAREIKRAIDTGRP